VTDAWRGLPGWTRRAVHVLLAVHVFLSVGFFATQRALGDDDSGSAEFLKRLFHMGGDPSLTAWWSTVILAFAGALALAVWLAPRIGADPGAPRPRNLHWLALAIVLGGLSLDEGAVIHETLGSLVGSRVGTSDDDFWPVLYLPGIAVGVWALWRVAREMRRPAAMLATVGIGALLVGVGSDLVPVAIGWEGGGAPGLGKSLLEENFELLGAGLVLLAIAVTATERILSSGVLLRLAAPSARRTGARAVPEEERQLV
jgi:hypothetical protein